MWRSACRAFLLLNGGNRWLGRTQPWIPPGFFTNTVTFGFFSRRVEKSTGGVSHQSNSPFSVLQPRRRRGGGGEVARDHTVDVGALPAGRAARRLVAGDVVGEALV